MALILTFIKYIYIIANMDHAPYQQKADIAFEKANKNIRKYNSKVYRLLLPKEYTNNIKEETIDYLSIAAKNYKLIKSYDQYVKSLVLKADIEKEMDNSQYLSTVMELGNHFSYTDSFNETQAINYYNLALTHCLNTDSSKIFYIYEKIIDIHNKSHNPEEAIRICEEILSEYTHFLNDSNIEKVYGKLSEYYFEEKSYEKAYNIYHTHAKKLIDKKYAMFVIDKYFYKALLCTLANNDVVNAKNKYAEYCDDSALFASSRSAKFVNNILEAVYNNNGEEFANHVQEYDKISKLSNAEVSCLLQIKKLYFSDNGEVDLT